jgi:hypothetical protein
MSEMKLPTALFAIATHIEEHDVRLNHDALVPQKPQFTTHEAARKYLAKHPAELREKYFIVSYEERPELWDMTGRTRYIPQIDYFERIHQTLIELKDGHVVINKMKHWYDKDELYCDWYQCPSCGDRSVRYKNNFCAHCGAQFKWTEGGDT